MLALGHARTLEREDGVKVHGIYPGFLAPESTGNPAVVRKDWARRSRGLGRSLC